ncbi:MAG TPA: hemerythrin family protein [Nitrospirae bacterium]|nr:hemerythrin family protein [Nitrospirota bacterium]
MEQFIWDNKLSVGVEEIDNQHKKLIELINQLIIKKEENKTDQEYLHSLLSELFNYTIYHFFTEEQIMENISYPDYGKHKAEHVNISSKVIEYFERFNNGEDSLYIEIFEFLKVWLYNHIMNTDNALGKYIQEWMND